MTPEIIKKLIGYFVTSNQLLEDLGLQKELVDEKDIYYVNFFLSLTSKSLDEKIALLATTADRNEKLLLLTQIIDNDIEDEIESTLEKILLANEELLLEIEELCENL